MFKGRNRPSGVGLFLGVFALCMRIVLVGAHPSAPTVTAGDLLNIVNEHALCLAGEQGNRSPIAPGDETPGQSHDHDDPACCQWHCSAPLAVPTRGPTLTHVAFEIIVLPVTA